MTEPEPEPKRVMVRRQRRLCPERWAAAVVGVAMVSWHWWHGRVVAGAPQVSIDQVRGVRGWGGDGCRAVAVAVAVAGMSRGK